MSERTTPELPKWPFVAGDLFLLVLASFIAFKAQPPLGPWLITLLVVCVLSGAWICALPFLREHSARLKLTEIADLKSATEQIENLRQVANQISFATAQWQLVQEQAGKTIEAATGIAERMTAEAKAFSEFMAKANDTEKAHLRLEVEKLHRSESDWVQTVVRVLDHVYALYLAGVKSGQGTLRENLTNFQNACRDAARRIGLMPFEATAGEAFDERKHQAAHSKCKPSPGAKIAETLATGFTYQGRMVRPAVVTLKPGSNEPDNQLLLDSMPEEKEEELAAEAPAAEEA
jgi:molecular chaperone GrpE (heat shock protein)